MTIPVFLRNKQFMIYAEDHQYAFHSFAQLTKDTIPLQQIRRKIPTLRPVTPVKKG